MNDTAVQMATTLDRVLGDLAPIGRQLDVLASAAVDQKLLDTLAGLGIVASAVPETEGGLGLEPDEIALLAWVGGRRLIPTITRLATSLVSPLLSAANPSGWACSFPTIVAPAGPTSLVWAPSTAERALVVREQDALLVDLADAEVVADPGLDAGQGRALLSYEPAAATVLQHPDHVGIVERARIAAVAELSGVADRVSEAAVHYAQGRSQFGRPIAEFQAVQHTLANMRAGCELVRSAVSRLVSLQAPEPTLTKSLATGAASTVRRLVEDAIQVHGGMGFTWEYGLHLYYRRCLSIQEQFGGPSAMLRTLGRTLVDRRTP